MSKIESPESPGRPLHPGLLDLAEAAEFLHVTPRLVRELWQTRRLTGIKVGRQVRFHESDLIEYIQRHRVEAAR